MPRGYSATPLWGLSHGKTVTLTSISPNLSWEFSVVSSLSWYSILVLHACNDRGWLTSECLPRYDNLVRVNRRDSRYVTSPASWVYILPRIKNSKKKMAGVLNAIRAREKFTEKRLCSISWIFLLRHKKQENWLKVVSYTSMYHTIACLTVPKLSFLGEHSEVGQPRSLQACWTRMLYFDSTTQHQQTKRNGK